MQFILLIFFAILFSCRNIPSPPPNSQTQKIVVVSTIAMIDDLVARIGQDKIQHTTLIIGDIDPHSYELVKGDDEKLKNASILFSNGLGLEHGASLQSCLKHHPNHKALGNLIYEKKPEAILVREGVIDPHIWMDVALWSETVDPIVEALSQAIPEEASFFSQNGDALKKEMQQMHLSFKQMISECPDEQKFLVTSHDAFNYFARSYLGGNWEERTRAPEGLAPEGQLSCLDIQNIVDYLLTHRAKSIFPESNVSRDSLNKIVHACHHLGFSVEIADKPLHADALGPKGSEADTYFKMMHYNVRVLKETWESHAATTRP